jgi:fatty acid CoA ligase FadD36
VAGVRTRIVDEAGRLVPDDDETVGELEVRGPTLFEGYLGQPDVTAAQYTHDGWFRTGDVAARAPDGQHRIVGRRSTDLIKSGGYRIGAGEVEAALLTHPGVHEAAVVGAPDADLGQVVVAFVVADGVTGEQLIRHVADGLSVHKRPRRVHLIDELPRNALGKVQKALLPPG